MTRSLTTGSLQLQLNLDQQLDEKPGRLLPLPLDPSEIGGELLAVLSKGLYTDPLDSIREYVQNAVDAGAGNVIIKLTGNSVIIRDDGQGMSLDDLLDARQFGLSFKSLKEHVGFRGIGIYSGFDLCRRLRITTKRAGESRQHVLVFEFADMRQVLDADRNRAAGDPKTSLIDLLSAHTFIKREPVSVPPDRHFTIVQLDEISDVHMRQLSNRAELRTYLLQNLPVAFADAFAHKEIIDASLRSHVPGYRAIHVTLQTDGLPDEAVAKYDQPDIAVRHPKTGYISTSTGPVAFYWACLNEKRGKIQPRRTDGAAGDGPSYEGLLYKMKGFAIGDRQRIGRLWEKVNGKPVLYRWYTGEVYVLDSNVIPNAERDDFETNHAKTALEVAVGEMLEALETEAEIIRDEEAANDRVEQYRLEFEKISEGLESNTHADDFETFAELKRIKREIGKHKKKSSAAYELVAEEVIKKIDLLQRQLREDVDSQIPEDARRKRAARSEQVQDRPAVPAPEPAPPPAPPKVLIEVLREAGWELEAEAVRLAEVVQESLEEVLTLGSSHYRNVLDDIEARVSPNGMDQ